MDRDRARTLAGLSLIGTGAITSLGFLTAAALVPGYSVSAQTISALGAEAGTPESRLVFNGAMISAGLVTLVAAYGLHVDVNHRAITGLMTITAVGGFVGVGLFPAQTGLSHVIAALISFLGVGVLALLVAVTMNGPFRYVSATLGGLELVALALFLLFGDANPLGIGGLERWVASLSMLWATAFGGVLLGSDTPLDA